MALKNLSLFQKLMGSFLMLALLVTLAGGTGIYLIEQVARSGNAVVEEHEPSKEVAMRASMAAMETIEACQHYLRSESELNAIEAEIQEGLEDIDMWLAMIEFGTESDRFKNSTSGDMYVKDGIQLVLQPGTEEMQQAIELIKQHQADFTSKASDLVKLHQEKVQYVFERDGFRYDITSFLYAADVMHRRWVEQLESSVKHGKPFSGELNPTQCALGTWLGSYHCDDESFMDLLGELSAMHRRIHGDGKRLMEATAEEQPELLKESLVQMKVLLAHLDKMQSYSIQLLDSLEKSEQFAMQAMFDEGEEMTKGLTDLQGLTNQEMDASHQKATDARYSARIFLLALIAVAFTLAVSIGWFISRSLTAALLEVDSISRMLLSNSHSLANASDELSSGAQEQASSLEETAASLEQITSTVQRNAEYAKQANQLSGQSRKVAENGGATTERAVEGMQQINEASRSIRDIITAIDEIAFQTNLLALNAAVESARAGEHGRGFAVVANEVGNLAQRSAEAAKQIKTLIEDSVSKVEHGSQLVEQSGETLTEIVTSVKSVSDLIEDIASASNEQAIGIEQVNRAVTQMDHVTQGNASQTEQLSSTADSLASQAKHLMALVDQFNLKRSHTKTAEVPVKQKSTAAPQAAGKRVERFGYQSPAKQACWTDDVDEKEQQLATAAASDGGYTDF
ncbi:methyl-accepting chemotaxis protein [Aeoliella mucimassa]|uniref:Methyl-accepting chemotaxis protein II n=1 Tax=Aeoliella mucimassa TaxID=2527972 RepID=A0A518AVI3_9BACT|nr:methyl-accepting chemotaxis protein [Aeoliella mucimassa]QDU58745.1 Methyl-accepting chemotaxis protein II [Aeoliella mucimassa]